MAGHDDWDSHWERYATAASRNPAQQMRHALVTKLLLRESRAAARRVLDLGSGQGDLLAKLHARLPQAELAGFELSASGVELSRRKVPAARFVVADLFRPPEALRAFHGWATDAVCSEVLEHVDSPEDFLRAAKTYLADGAQLIVTVPGGPISAFDRHIGHRRHFTAESLRGVLERAGFEVERVYRSGFPFFNLYRCVVIARGEKLADDGASRAALAAWTAGVLLAAFNGLFRLNLMSSPFGWQMVAVARRREPIPPEPVTS